MDLGATLRTMLAAGCTAEQLVAFVEKVEDERKAKATQKKRRQRGQESDSTADVPGTKGDKGGQEGTKGDSAGQKGTEGDAEPLPRAHVVNTNLPSEDINTYPSDRTGKPVTATPKSRLWSEAVPTLIALGIPERQTRSVIGRWLKSNSPDAVLEVVSAAGRECPMAPIPWITAALRPAVRAGPPRKPSVTDAILDLLAEERAQ
ncbi:MAG: hypothetical protein ACK4MV_09595 [Beijerinckiaceae bacterium]